MVNYFSIVNDVNHEVTFIMDENLMNAPYATFHPMDNTGSIAITAESIRKIAKIMNRDESNFFVMDLTKADPAAKPIKKGK